MKNIFFNNCCRGIYIVPIVLLVACTSPTPKKSNTVNQKTNFLKGSYGYDIAFFESKKIQTIELKDDQSKASLLLLPGYQGRVMTSSAKGNEGTSFGWINYKLIESGEVSNKFNPYGGEERLWIGPEGGPFSIYFPKGKEQIYANWMVPKEIDTKPFDVVAQTPGSVSFRKEFALPNASGTNMEIGLERSVKLLTCAEAEKALQLSLDTSLNYVAYESENILTNKGKSAWTEKTGFLSIWLLAMFNPSEEGVVFIPFKEGSEAELGKIVTDDYFGKVPSDRLVIKNGVVFFKTDGKSRSKIGISPKRALPYCGSYDPIKRILTLLWYSKPEMPAKYVNSKWGNKDNLLSGDVVNSYNDGPVEDGSVMGPFYEIESSSPAAILAPGEKITHKQRIFHISGDETKLSLITEKLFNLPISAIKQAFK
ncbi:MAG TPA: DUF6786 family protein [Prolixibacteraceae bacterium]